MSRDNPRNGTRPTGTGTRPTGTGTEPTGTGSSPGAVNPRSNTPGGRTEYRPGTSPIVEQTLSYVQNIPVWLLIAILLIIFLIIIFL